MSLLALIALAGGPTLAVTPAPTERRVTRLAEGVYAIEHRDVEDGFAGGNTTVIIGERQVFVVDAPFLPSEAREDIAQIRQWTGKPVSFVLNTHFHNDHNLGNRAYMDAFPGVTIIAQTETRRDMDRFGPGSARRVEKSKARLQEMLKAGKDGEGKPFTQEYRKALEQAVTRRTEVLDELKGMTFQSATLTFEREFTVDLGGREVEVRFLGRGNTAGDAVAFLPAERIVATGDLVVHPLPYVFDGYPSEWIRTLDNLAGLNPLLIVPGHGPILRDQTFLTLTRDLFQSAVTQVGAELARNGPAFMGANDERKKAVDLSSFRSRFAGKDAELASAFDAMAANLVSVAFTEASLR